MNWCVNSSKSAVAAWLSAGFVMVLPVAAAPVAQPAAPEVVSRSVFVVPTNPKDGRDPFFPNSTRSYETVSAGRPHAGDVSSLVLKGISGPPNHRLVIINNHTFGVGDEENLVTSQGPIHIRCVEIKAGSVVIESGGQRHELSYANNR
ncbi:MAG: hypothetical protein ACLPYZ_03185 [Limisphaerales bacterium]